MKLDQISRQCLLTALGFSLFATGFSLRSATITWGPAMQIVGDADVNTNGTLVEADAVGNGSSPAVNGVTFAAWNGNSSSLAAGGSGVNLQSSGYGAGVAPFSDLSSGYQSLLSAGANASASASLVLSNLTIGDQYEVQIWANDANGDTGAETIDGVTTLFYDNAGLAGHPGSYALGTFVADATTETISLSATNGASSIIFNALELRRVSAGTALSLGVSAFPTNNTLAVATVTLSAPASGTGLSYQWLSDVGNPGHLSAVGGAVGSSFAVRGDGVGATNQYQVVVSNAVGVSTSAVVTVTQLGPPTNGITWGTPTTISGDSDVNTNGAGLFAYNANIFTNLLVNGVSFTQFLPIDYYTHPSSSDYGASTAVDGVTNGNGTATLWDGNGTVYYFNYGNYPGFGATSGSFTNLSTNYQEVLSGAIGGLGSDDTLTLVFSQLFPGAVYGVQYWVNDSRSCCFGRSETVSDLDGDVATLSYNPSDTVGGPGQYVLGEGVADANGTMTIVINALGTYQQVNAFQLRSPSIFPPFLLSATLGPTNFVYAGATLTIAGGAAGPVGVATTYQWQWNQGSGNSFINFAGSAGTNSTLTVDTTGFSTGNYLFRLVASNAYGTNTTQPIAATIDALAAPVISGLNPQNLTVFANAAPVTLGATVNGSLPLTYLWLWDGGTGSGALSALPGANASSLVVNPANVAANATYTYELVASNFLGVATSAPIHLTIAAIPQAPSSGFSWSPVAAANTDADVATNGTGVIALVANSPVTINGVTFEPFVPAGVSLPQGPGDYYQGSETEVTASTNNVTATLTSPNSSSPGSPFYWYNAFTSSSGPFSQLSTPYKNLLAGGIGAPSGPDTWLLAFTGLTPGSNYLFQFWVNDPRGIQNIGDRFDILSDGGTNATSQSAPLLYETPLTGGVGSYVIGATKAGVNGDINITILGSAETELNAFQLRQLASPGANAQPFLTSAQPSNVVEYAGQTGTVTLSVVPTGSEPLSFQWFASSGGAFSPTAGATNASLPIDTSGFATGTYQYRLVVSNVVGAVTSSVANVTVSPIPTAPVNGVAWGPAATILGDTDVATAGSSVLAGVANTPVTLNGVSFASFLPPNADLGNGQDFPLQDTFIAETNGNATATLTAPNSGSPSTPFFWYTSFGQNAPPYSDLSANYQSFLTGSIGANSGNDTWNMSFTGLVAGNTYAIQYWVDDSRHNGLGRIGRLSDSFGNPTVTLEYNTSPTGANGGLGQFAMGTAKADGSGTVSFTINSGDSLGLFGQDTQMTGFQLRNITGTAQPVTVSIALNAGSVVITWNGNGQLLEATSVAGPWTPVSGAASPYTVAASGAQAFFQVKQ